MVGRRHVQGRHTLVNVGVCSAKMGRWRISWSNAGTKKRTPAGLQVSAGYAWCA